MRKRDRKVPRTAFEQGLEDSLDAARLLASHVDKAIGDAMEALRARDMALARSVVDGDAEVNVHRYNIEEAVRSLMALQAPVASDLRELVFIRSIVTDLERVGDHAEGIARIALFLGEDPAAASGPELWLIAEKEQTMLRSAIAAFVQRDVDLAHATCDLDKDVDTVYDRIHRHLIQRLAGISHDVHKFDMIMHVLWTSHNLERIGDRATNICERAIFLFTGKLEEINVSKY